MLDRSRVPDDVSVIAAASSYAQLATVNRSGDPIVDALLPVAGVDGRTIDFGTGLAYPAKAERARRNPRVGIFLPGSGDAGSGFAVIGALAAVRDRDLQANTDRWVAAYRDTWLPTGALDREWEQAVCYFVRVFILCSPVVALWWPDGDPERPPMRWRAPADTRHPQSDPAPPGRPTAGPGVPPRSWPEEADRVLSAGLPPPVLTTIGDGGFPLPLPTRRAWRHDDGFEVDLRGGLPLARTGPACVSFEAREANPPGVGANFVGVFESSRNPSVWVERVLPANYRAAAYRQDPAGHLFQPPQIQDHLLRRLLGELDRRAAQMPVIRGLDACRNG
jgi:hypothetical protein